MKKLEEIEKEYENFTTDKPFITNLGELLVYIEIGLDNLIEDQEAEEKEIRHLKRDMMMLKLMDFIMLNPIEEDDDVNFLIKDIEAISKAVELANTQATYFARIAESATAKNFKEMLKLVDFATKYYSENMEYIDYLRDFYEFRRKGINMFISGKEDHTEVFDEFMQKELAKYEIEKTKPVEKIKK